VPEGDTILRAARTLHAALAGRRLTAFDSRLVAVAAAAARLRIVGRTIERVTARGKHLLFVFEGGAVLHTHQGMRGSWRLQPAAAPRGRTPPLAALETSEVVALCHHAPVVEWLAPLAARSHPALSRLGPDLLAPGFDSLAARRRLRACARPTIGEALLDQTVMCGIGNVYKSEVLFLCRVPPTAAPSALDDATLDRLIATARRLLQRNLGPGPRRTTSPLAPSRLHVYRRAGEPCRDCGARILRLVQGEQARSTWFCPSCQGPG
jgi:endonuclease-8